MRLGRPPAGPAAPLPAPCRRVPRPEAAGFSAIEVLVALLLLAALLHLCRGLATEQRRGLAALVARSEVLDAERTLWWVLSSEIEGGRAARDWREGPPDVLELRAFRGRGVPCPGVVGPAGWIEVRWTGWRTPDPPKDSLLTMDGRGRWRARDLVARSPGGGECLPRAGERVERWRIRPPPERPVVLLRLFERGSYHLEDAAFRYRRGRAGRQPLTAEVLDPRASGLAVRSGRLTIRFRGDPAAGAAAPHPDSGWTRVLRGGR